MVRVQRRRGKALVFASTEGLARRTKLPRKKLLLLGDKPPSQSQQGGVSWRTKAFLVWLAESQRDEIAGRVNNEPMPFPTRTGRAVRSGKVCA